MCEAPDCDRKTYARGLCARHYKQVRRHGAVQQDRPAAPCTVPACGRTAVTRGWCHGHYLRWSRTGDLQEDRALERPARGTCRVPECGRPHVSAGLCRAHRNRELGHGDISPSVPVRRRAPGGGSISHGYRTVPVPPSQRHLVPPGRTKELEHRLVMARALGRPLTGTETVHHVNGDRLDNRPANLELWTTAQPKGQRVADKLAWAYDLLARYDAEASGSLGLDLDPHSGRLRQAESLPSQ